MMILFFFKRLSDSYTPSHQQLGLGVGIAV